MLEPRPDMLPDQPQTDPEIEPEILSDPEPEPEEVDPELEEPGKSTPSSPASPAKQSEPEIKTPAKELHAALQEERRKRKELQRELELARINSSVPSELADEVLSDEGKALKTQLDAVTKKLSLLETQRTEEEVYKDFPQVLDKADEFEAFRTDPENAGMSLKTAAKAFVYEKGLITTTPRRKGVERATHGPNTAPKEGVYTAEEVARLMQTNYREFEKLVRAGKIDPDKIVGVAPDVVMKRR